MENKSLQEHTQIIEKFSSHRPQSIAVFGYGSSIFKQANNNSHNIPQTDVIIIVDDIVKWHRNNMKQNPTDYSVIGTIHLNRPNIEKIKGYNKVTYFSEIKDGNCRFKYGVIEVEDFKRSLSTWDNLFMAGRFHKPILRVRTREDINESITQNREIALRLACLFSDTYCTRRELLLNLCGLSYLGDTRMKLAENPHKVANIVDGNFAELNQIYSLNEDYIIPIDNDHFLISHQKILEEISLFPSCLLEYLIINNVNPNDLQCVRYYIKKYIYEKNHSESKAQIFEGLKTNGLVRSVPYALAKVSKRFSK